MVHLSPTGNAIFLNTIKEAFCIFNIGGGGCVCVGGGGEGGVSIFINIIASKSGNNEPRFTELVRSFTVVAVVEVDISIPLSQSCGDHTDFQFKGG